MKTQEQCRLEWEALKREFLARIKAINDDTPAKPYEEPKWWCDMVDAEAFILSQNNSK